MVGVRAETQLGWRAGVLGSSVVEFGRIRWAVELGILEKGELGCCWNSRWFGGDYWMELGEEWRAEVVEFWVRLGGEFGEILKVFLGSEWSRMKRRKNVVFSVKQRGILRSLSLWVAQGRKLGGSGCLRGCILVSSYWLLFVFICRSGCH